MMVDRREGQISQDHKPHASGYGSPDLSPRGEMLLIVTVTGRPKIACLIACLIEGLITCLAITTDAAASPDERALHLPLDHHALDLGDGLGGVEALGAGLGAIHDGMAAVEPERILEIVEAVTGRLVAAVLQPAVGLK